MRKLILALIALAVMVSPVVAADYYVSPDGDDAAAGTSAETPWKTVARLNIQSLSAGDTVTIAGTSPTLTIRGGIETNQDGENGNPIIYESDSGQAYVAKSLDCSENGVYSLWNRYFENWVDPSNLQNWTEANTVVREAVDVNNGTYSVKITGSNGYIRDTLVLPKNDFRIHVIYKTDATGSFGYTLKDTTTNDYLQSDGSWDAAYSVNGNYTSTTWQTATIPETGWATPSQTGDFRFDIKSTDAGTDVYIDGFWVEIKNNWEQYAGDTYQLSFRQFVMALFKSTDFLTTGVDGMVVVEEGSDEDSLASGQYYFDEGSNLLFYRLASDENIGDLHFEVNVSGTVFDTSHDYIEVNNITAVAGQIGWNIHGTDVNFVGTSIKATLTGNVAFYVSETPIVVLYNPTVYNLFRPGEEANKGDGYVSIGGSTTLWHATCYDVGDDCYQPSEDAEYYAYYSVGYNVQGSVVEISMEEAGDTGTAEFYNCEFIKSYGNAAACIRDKSGVNATTKFYNNISRLDDGSANVIIDATDRSGGTGNFDSGNNIVYGTDAEAGNFTTGYDATVKTPDISSDRGVFIPGFHDTANGQSDYDGNQVVPYQIPIGAQGYERAAAGIVSNAGVLKNGSIGN